MRSTLKKSLYLGLAALSFASVAGAANNADAAKKTKPAKTYATASYQNIPDQGQSNVAYNVTGSNALFNKPGTVKGAKQTASKATMSDLASSKQNFMVYQTATTNRGSKYIKVVSFDKQYRGWIYAGNNTSAGYGTGVQQINLSATATPQYSNVYLKSPGQVALRTSPEGAQFNDSQNSFAQTGFVAKDKFNVDAAQTVTRTGTTWYHLTDQYNSSVSGWVPNDQVQLTASDNYFDARNQVKVNYTNDQGQVVKTSYVNIDRNATNSNYSGNFLDTSSLADHLNMGITNNSSNTTADSYINAAASDSASSTDLSNAYPSNSPLNDSGYKLAQAFTSSTNGLNYVRPGDTINAPVKSTSQYGPIASKVTFNTTNGISASSIDKNSIFMPSINTDTLKSVFNGNNYQYLQLGDGTNTDSGRKYGLLNNGLFNTITASQYSSVSSLGTIFGKDQTAINSMNNGDIQPGNTFHYEYTINKDATRANNVNKTYGQDINLYYTQVAVKNSSNINNPNTGQSTNYSN